MNTTPTAICATQTAGSAARTGLWSIDAVSALKARHLIAASASKPMPSATYEVQNTNGFDRRPSEGST